MPEQKKARIDGPPGTGKTTEILRLMAAACKKYDAERIGASSLTKAAVQEMRSRVARASGVQGKVNKNIRTMHSHGFHLLELSKDKVAESKIDEWNAENPDLILDPGAIAASMRKADEVGFAPPVSSKSTRTEILGKVNMHRLRMTPESEWSDYERVFYDRWKRWMFQSDYIDYTGMLEGVLEKGLCPDIDVLFIDEAQDMSPLQCAITDMWSKNTDTTVYAGDYQQAIFRFAGASPEVFKGLEADWSKALTQSYRVPKNILPHAMKIISKATDCSQFQYSHREGDEGQYLGITKTPDLGLDGSHMIICRYRAQVSLWTKMLLKEGVPFKNDYRPTESGWNPCASNLWSQAAIYMKLAGGQVVLGKDMASMLQGVKIDGNIQRGEKDNVVQSLDMGRGYSLFDLHEIKGLDGSFAIKEKPLEDVFRRAKVAAYPLLEKTWKEPSKIINPPNVTVGTIHSVKGGEADNVWIENRIGKAQVRRVAFGGATAMNDEYRVSYVAVTRARRRLGFITARERGMNNPFLL